MNSNEHGGAAFPMPSGPEPRVDSATHYNEGMSLRQYAAIHLRVPQSGIDWLDKMIKESNGGAVDLVGLNIEPDYLDGQWHDWHGGECPVRGDTSIGAQLKNGDHAGYYPAYMMRWTHQGTEGDIIRFRVAKP